jgi:hypothetical protein
MHAIDMMTLSAVVFGVVCGLYLLDRLIVEIEHEDHSLESDNCQHHTYCKRTVSSRSPWECNRLDRQSRPVVALGRELWGLCGSFLFLGSYFIPDAATITADIQNTTEERVE